MAAEGGEPGGAAFDLFSAAEAACEEAIECILTEGGRLLHDSYIEKKSFSFASQAVSQLLVSELKMCFVRCDGGEPLPAAAGCAGGDRDARDSWTLEPEPPRCRVDTWARACVPIRKKLVRPKGAAAAEEGKRRQRAAKAPSTSNSSAGRSPSRAGGTAASLEQSEVRAAAPTRAQMIPLTDEHEEDEEEDVMRDMKEREARRKREEEQRLQRKASEEAEEAVRLAQVKDQMKNKPFTYDSSGDLIWVQPLQPSKLPSNNPAPTYSFKKDSMQQTGDTIGSARPPLARSARRPSEQRGGGGRRATAKREGEFPDSFKKFAAQQPSMMEAMSVAPGVELSERGRTKKGLDEQAQRRPGQTMSRREYEDMVHGGADRPGGQASSAGPSRASSLRDLAASGAATPRGGSKDVESPRADAGRSPALAAEAREGQGPTLKVVRRPDMGAELVPHPPASPRPVQPAAPPTFRRVQMKRDALGYALSTRERVATGTSSRFPNCAAQPPLGATMGHGLVPAAQNQEVSASPSTSAPASLQGSPRMPEGHIVSRNPELARRLFPR